MTNQNGRRYLSAAELGAILSYVRTQASMARRKGGLRPYELCALRIWDLPGTHGETTLWIRDTSGGISRKVNISEDLAERLARFARFYRNGAQGEELLLKSKRGGPVPQEPCRPGRIPSPLL